VDEAALLKEWAAMDYEMLCRATAGVPRYS
jgi:hypothetical protein